SRQLPSGQPFGGYQDEGLDRKPRTPRQPSPAVRSWSFLKKCDFFQVCMQKFTISVKEISMESNSTLDRGSSRIAPESTGVEARKQPVRLDDRDFLEAVSRAVLRELEGGFNLGGGLIGNGPTLQTAPLSFPYITVGVKPLPLIQ